MAEKKSKIWFLENVSDNAEELLEIGEFANKQLLETISLGLNSPATTIAIYSKIFETICDVVVEQEKDWSDFQLNIADRLIIGYTTTDDENDEKQGNFMVYMLPGGSTRSDKPLDDDERDTITLCTQWNAANVKTQPEVIKAIASRGRKALDSIINIKMESDEFIIPMFCVIHSQIVSYIRTKRVELNQPEYELNIAGLYTIGITETDDAEENIYYVPSITLKLKFKNDAEASGKYE